MTNSLFPLVGRMLGLESWEANKKRKKNRLLNGYGEVIQRRGSLEGDQLLKKTGIEKRRGSHRILNEAGLGVTWGEKMNHTSPFWDHYRGK